MVPPLAKGRRPVTSAVREITDQSGALVPLPLKKLWAAPWTVWDTWPVESVKRTPLSVFKEEKVTVEEAFRVVVETPRAPRIAPPEVILIVGELRKLVKPLGEAKLIPFIILVLLLEAAGKLIPFNTSVLFILEALLRARLKPLTEVEEADVLAFVKFKA